jgi:hypothetical protein
MITLAQARPYLLKIVREPDTFQKERLFENLLILHNPELIIVTKIQTIKNLKILHRYLYQFEYSLHFSRLKNRHTIEICANFMRIWILELLVQLEDYKKHD